MSDSESNASSDKDDEVKSQQIESENDDSASEKDNDDEDDAKSEHSDAENGSKKDTTSQADKASRTGSRKSRTESVVSYVPYVPYEPPVFGLEDSDYGSNYIKDFDVVCVHGAHVKRDWTWGHEQLYGSDWVSYTLFGFWSMRKLTFWYDADNRLYRPDGIRTLAQELLDEVVEKRKNIDQSEKPRAIVFIAHDVGGAIVKMALIIAAMNPSKYGEFPFLTSTLIFLACPHRTIGSEVLQDQLATLLVMDPSSPKTGVVRKAKQLAATIQTINADFLETKMLTRAGIFNVYPVEKDPTKTDEQLAAESRPPTPAPEDEKPKQPQVIPFDKFTSTFNSPFEFNVWTTRSHRDLIRGEDAPPEGTWPLTVREVLNLVPYYMDIDERIAGFNRLILTQCPPFHPFKIPHDPTNPFYKAFNEHETTKKWLAGSGLCILHAHGKADIIQTSQRIFQALDSTLPLKNSRFSVLYFQFDRTDIRFNNIKAMLCSFLGTIMSRYSFELEDNIVRAINLLIEHNAWSTQDVYRVFDWLRDSTSTEELTYVISCLDQCDESRDWFLSELPKIGLVSESRYKWVITSSDPGFLKDAVPDSFALDLDELAATLLLADTEPDADKTPATSEKGEDAEPDAEAARADPAQSGSGEEPDSKPAGDDTTAADVPVESGINGGGGLEQKPELAAHEGSCPNSEPKDAVDEDLESDLTRLFEHRPATATFETEIRDLVAQCSSDVELRRILLAWLHHKSRDVSRATVLRLIDRLQHPTPDGVFKIMLDSVDPETRDRAQRLLALLPYTIRPLSVYEVATFLTFDATGEAGVQPADLWDILHEILPTFGGIFKLDRNEIRLGHPYFEQPVKDVGGAHADITSACLRYLSQKKVQEQIQTFSDHFNQVEEFPNGPSFELRFDLISYAVKAWPTHYRLAGSNAPVEAAVAFFRGKQTVIAWHEAYYTGANKMGLLDQGYLSSLPVLAITGLGDVMARRIEEERSSQNFAADCDLALVEAAAYGHVEIVRALMKVSEPGRPALKSAIKAAAGYGEGGALSELVEHATAIEGFEWPDFLLCRFAFLGFAELTQKLIDCHVEVDPKEPEQGLSPLHMAARWRHEAVAKVLLDAKASITFLADFENSPLHTAAQAGHPGIVKLLVDAGAELEAKNNEKVTPTQGSADWARPAALKVLLEAGGDYEYGDIEDEEATASCRKPIVHAAQNNYIQCVKLLLAKGADANAMSVGGNALYVAVEAENLEVCRLLVEHGAKPDSSDKRELLLIRAVQLGNVELVKLLLDNGADIEEEGKFEKYRNTALTRAAGEGSKEMVDLLLERKADPKHFGEDSQPPIYAATYGHIDIVRKLLEAGADPNALVKETQWSAVHAAYDNPDIMRLLLEKGGDVDGACDSGTPLYLAARWNYPETIKVLLEHDPKPNLEAEMTKEGDEENGMTALCIACREGNPEVMRLLLDEGANPNHKTKDGSFALEFCVYSGGSKAEEALRTLLEFRPRLDLTDNDGNTVLHSIRYYTPFPVVKLLVNGGADLDMANKAGYSSLCTAIENGSSEIAAYLLKKKARPNVFGPTFGSPLHLACNNGYLGIVKALVEAGADVNYTGPEWPDSALYAACTTSYAPEKLEIITYLIEEAKVSVNVYGGALGYPVTRTCLHSDSICLDYLLGKGADPDVEDEFGRRPIHMASYLGMHNVQPLLDKGVLINVKDKLGRTPLHWAVLSGSTETVEKILDLLDGAVNVPDNDDWTPLMWACRISDYWQTTVYYQAQIVTLLIERGADIWARGKGWDREWSPLKIARFYRADQSVQDLLEPKDKERITESGKKETWDAKFHESKPGNLKYRELCFGCVFEMTGAYWDCLGCKRKFRLCFKCYRSRDVLHPGHEFKEVGPEYDEIVEEERHDSTVEVGATPAGEHGDSDSESNESDHSSIEIIVKKRRASKNESESESAMGVDDEESEEDDDEDEEESDSDA